MKCPECVEAGQESKVYDHGSTSTLMGWSVYFDEQGIRHSHDPNWHTNGFRCSNDHYFAEKFKTKCINCDFGGPA